MSYATEAAEWKRCGGSLSFAIPQKLWDFLATQLRPGLRTVETGSGLSTWLFDAAECRHVALEHEQKWATRVASRPLRATTQVLTTKLVGNPKWYDWVPREACDLLLIDGPPGKTPGRSGVLRALATLVTSSTVVVLDDVNRESERRLAAEIARRLNRVCRFHPGGDDIREFAVFSGTGR